MASNITCLVTLHGIGFQQPPEFDKINSGYADLLHTYLSARLGRLLSDDPGREHPQTGANGPIYVQSLWREDGLVSREAGLKRLGSWSQDGLKLDTSAAPLVSNGRDVAHVALVYSNLEPEGPRHGAGSIALGMSLYSASHYAHAWGLLHMAVNDVWTALGHHGETEQGMTSDRPRTDGHSALGRQQGQRPDVSGSSVTALTILRNLEDDVASYVCSNGERERVRSFVFEALLRLASREDVEAIVLNTHSNGTVIALDVLRYLPLAAARKFKAFITAGSPLRKHVTLFHWGEQLELPTPMCPWENFWDRHDPVADPLAPPITWRLGDKPQASGNDNTTLFTRLDPSSGATSSIQITDHEVDNVRYCSGGGLRAHNYWDNTAEFVPQLASILGGVAEQRLALRP